MYSYVKKRRELKLLAVKDDAMVGGLSGWVEGRERVKQSPV